ncbi:MULTISPECIES: glycosyltransferase family 2 protein [Cupriavidus]
MKNESPGISILILTKNEEQDLPGCLESVAWSDDIHVYDSGSSDNTVNIARNFGATVTSRTYNASLGAFGGDEATHRNWALRNLSFKNSWVLVVDADERVTPELENNAKEAIQAAGDIVVFRIQRRDFLLGTWLRHVQASPYYLRLLRPERVRYERLVNPVLIPDGLIGQLSGYLDHFPFSKGLDHWIAKHNSYSRLEAIQITKNKSTNSSQIQAPSIRKALFSRDFHQRRYHQKEIFYRLPFRPFAKFIALYLIKRGFLDGRAGFIYATLQSIYEYFIIIKTKELSLSTLKTPYSIPDTDNFLSGNLTNKISRPNREISAQIKKATEHAS